MTHAANLVAQYREAAEEEDVPADMAEGLRERAAELAETLVTPVVEISCERCGGRSLVKLRDFEDPHVVGRVWSCPHCPTVKNISACEVAEVALLSAHPGDVDAMDALDEYDRANGWGGPKRWAAYREVVVKGRVGAEVARVWGVHPSTVYSHVSRAKDALVEATT